MNNYRGKRIDNGGLVTGWLFICQYDKKCFIISDEYGPNAPETEGAATIARGTYLIEVIPESVGQFTGKQDTGGKDVYAGDIGADGGIVGWNDADAAFLYNHPDDLQSMYECESWLTIAGNATDNPELLEAKE